MALSSVTLSVDVNQLLGDDLIPGTTRAYVTTNVANKTLMDTSTGEIRMGDQLVTLDAAGEGFITTWVPGADGNPVSWQTSLVVQYRRQGARQRETRTFGPWTLSVANDGDSIAALEEEQAVPAEYLTQVTDELQTYSDAAEVSATSAAASATTAVNAKNQASEIALGDADATLAAAIDNPASATYSSLTASTAAAITEQALVPTATVADLPTVSYFAHGGQDGGDAPTDSFAAYEMAVARGLNLDVNLSMLGDGTMACIHGPYMSTVNGRTGTDKVEWFDALTIQGESLVIGTRMTAASLTQRIPLFRDVLRRYANRVVISPEIKLRDYDTDGGVATGLVAAARVRNDILAANAERSVIVQCFNSAVLAPIVAAGIPAMWLAGSNTVDGAALAAAGIEWVGVAYSSGTAQTQINAAKAAGLKVMIYNPLKVSDYSSLTGYDAVDSDQASYLSGFFRRSTDLFRSGALVPGMVPSRTSLSTGTFASGGIWQFTQTDDVYRSVIHAYMQPASGTAYTLQCDIRLDAAGAGGTGRWASLLFGAPSDRDYDNVASVGANGYHLLFRGTGVIDLYRVTDGAVMNIGTVASTAPTLGTTWATIRVQVTATQIIVTRTDTGHTFTATNSEYRGKFIHAARFGMAASFRNLSVAA